MASSIRARAASTSEMLEAFGDESLVRAALRFEATLASAQAEVGLIPASASDVIARACDQAFGIAELSQLAENAAHAGTLAIPLVSQLRARVTAIDPAAGSFVHRGSTSQDLADTALMLQARDAMAILARDLRLLQTSLAALARTHAATPMVGRTLLQAALPVTFGLKAAQWLTGVASSSKRLEREARTALALQLGGAAGTRSSMEGHGAAIATRMAAALGLANPALPWHARRDDLVALGCALATLIGALGKIARDVSLLAQNEIAEAFEPKIEGRGGSSAMAHKRNPTGCQIVLSAALRSPGLASTLLSAMPQEHERGLGGFPAEAPVLVELFTLAHGAVAALLPVIARLEVHPEAMAANLASADVGVDTAESEALVLAALLDLHL